MFRLVSMMLMLPADSMAVAEVMLVSPSLPESEEMLSCPLGTWHAELQIKLDKSCENYTQDGKYQYSN